MWTDAMTQRVREIVAEMLRPTAEDVANSKEDESLEDELIRLKELLVTLGPDERLKVEMEIAAIEMLSEHRLPSDDD